MIDTKEKQRLCEGCKLKKRRNYFCYEHGDEVRRVIKNRSTCRGWGNEPDFKLHNAAKETDPVLIAIPARDCEALTFKCLEYLANYAGVPFHVLYIDDGSKLGVAGRVETKAKSLNIDVEVMHFAESIGFAKACNIAFCMPGYRHVLLLNNDCYVGPDCLSRMRDWLDGNERAAAVGPMTSDDGCLSIMNPNRRKRANVKGPLVNRYDPVEGAKLCHSKFSTAEHMLPFFCTMFKSEAIKSIGLQSTHTDYAYGLGADDDWCRRAINKGWKLLGCCDAFAAHLHKQSFNNHQIDRSGLSSTALNRFQNQQTKKPSLSIITRRHVSRPQAFKKLSDSIIGQTARGSQHVILDSPGQIGIPGANRMLATDRAVDLVDGDYVQVIDDDDILCSAEYVEKLQEFIIDQGYPDWVMVRGKINNSSYPKPWGEKWKPIEATVACFCIVTSRELWKKHHAAWGVDRCGDWSFTRAMWDDGNRPVWFDFEACQTQDGRSFGRGEVK